MADDYVKMLERFAEYRRSLALLQSNVADTLGITQSRFSKSESGQQSISNDFLTALYESGWDIDYVVAGITSKKKKKELCEVLAEFNGDNECFKLIHWAMYNMCKNKSDFDVYSMELNLLNFLCNNEDVTVFEAIRHINNFSQMDYAEKLHLRIKKCRNLEKGVVYPSADLLRHMYNLFGCRPSLLLNVKDIKWNIMENIWSHIPEEEEQFFINFINNAVFYYLRCK